MNALTVPSRSQPGAVHHVWHEAGAWRCDCAGFYYRGYCRHLPALEVPVSITDITSTTNGGAHETSALALWTDEEIRIIKEQIAGGMSPPITDAEFRYFRSVCQARRLSPIAGQILPVRRGGRMVIQIAIHGLRSLADATGDYAPGRRSTFETTPQGGLVSATAYVLKYARGTWHEVEETAFWTEYVQTNGRGEPQALWETKPRVMLAKVAEALALRRAFPAALGSLYTDDELGRDVLADGHSSARPVVTATAAEMSGRPAPRPQPQLQSRREAPNAPPPSTNMTAWWSSLRAAGWDAPAINEAAWATFGRRVEHLDADQRAVLHEAALAGRVQATPEGVWRIVEPGADPPVEEGAPME